MQVLYLHTCGLFAASIFYLRQQTARRRVGIDRGSHGTQATQTDHLDDVSVWVTTQSRGIYKGENPLTTEPENKKKRSKSKEVGFMLGASLVMQTVIGPGIFTSPKGVTMGTGSVALNLLIWLACGIFTTLAALCFAELQIFVRRDGCEYGYIHKAFGSLPSFIYTWMRITAAEPITTAVFAVAFSHYLADSLMDNCGPAHQFIKLTGVTIIMSLAILNTYSLRLARQIQSLANLGKVVTLSIIIGTGIYRLTQGHTDILKTGFQNTQADHHEVVMGIYNCLWAYGGWAYVPNVTTAVRKPPKYLPRLIKFVIPCVMVIYLLTMTSYFTVLTYEDIVGYRSFGVIWGLRVLGKASFVIPIGVAMVALGNANNTFLSSGRLSALSVHDGYTPDFLSYNNVKSKAPLPAIIVRCVSAALLSLLIPTDMMVRFWVFTVWLFHGLAIFGLIVMRIRKPHLRRPYKVNILIPMVVVAGSAYLILAPFITRKPRPEFIFSLSLLAFSFICYFPFARWNLSPRFVDKFTILLQLFLNVAPHVRKYNRKSRTKHRRGPSTVTPAILPPDMTSEQDRRPKFSDDQSDIFSIYTLDTLDDLDGDAASVTSVNTRVSATTFGSFTRTSSQSSESRPPPYEEAVYITRL